MDKAELEAFRKEKRFSIEEMEADRGNAVRFICEAFGFRDVRADDSMVSLARRIRDSRPASRESSN
jgi:hypothetical protein